MSVINDMLRDLDKRQAPELGVAQPVSQESLIGPQPSPYPKIALVVLILLAFSGVGYIFLVGKETTSSYEQAISSTLNEVAEQERDSYDKGPTVDAAKGEKVLSLQPLELSSDSQAAPVLSKTALSDSQENKASKIDPVSRTPEKSSPDKVISEHTAKQVPTLNKPKEITASNARTNEKTVMHHVNQGEIEKGRLEKDTTHKTVPDISMMQEQNSMEVKLSPIALDQQMAQRALSLISQHKQTDAYRELYAFIGEHQEDMESRTVLARYLLQENRLAEVGDVLLNAPLEKSPALRQLKARWYVQQSKPKLALYTLNSNLPEVSANPDYYVLLAAYYQRYGTAKEAKETYSILVDYDETVADWWAGLGLASDRNNEREKAIYAYQQALELSGLSPDLLKFVKPRFAQLRVSQ